MRNRDRLTEPVFVGKRRRNPTRIRSTSCRMSQGWSLFWFVTWWFRPGRPTQEYSTYAPDTSYYPTTSFLATTTLIYALGAGITAAAGTRLALQLLLDRWFKSFPFRLTLKGKPICLVTTSLSLGVGNLRACCRPWTW
jgi:hypothetical protein